MERDTDIIICLLFTKKELAKIFKKKNYIKLFVKTYLILSLQMVVTFEIGEVLKTNSINIFLKNRGAQALRALDPSLEVCQGGMVV